MGVAVHFFVRIRSGEGDLQVINLICDFAFTNGFTRLLFIVAWPIWLLVWMAGMLWKKRKRSLNKGDIAIAQAQKASMIDVQKKE